MKTTTEQNLTKKQRAKKSRWISLIGFVALAAGCVERRVAYVPAYQAPQVYSYSAASVLAASTNSPPAGQTVATQQPPPAQVEVVPVSPGPEYAWTPGYWSWNGGWVWIGGSWVIRPHPGAVWLGGHWARRGHGWVWLGGRWR